ncbi:MAG: DUF3552 domain-containing protein, partial [Bacteroidetes bacterium]|nr:DUF3552 domain-containing protein [Bacteroidota bacterium]
MDLYILIPLIVFLCVTLFFLGWMLNSQVGKSSISSSEERAKKIIQDAEKESVNIKREKLLEVKDEWYKKKQNFDQEVSQKKNQVQNYEKQIKTREETLEKKLEVYIKKEKTLLENEKELSRHLTEAEKKNLQLDTVITEQNIRLERTAGLTRDEAKKMLIENLSNEAKAEAAQSIKNIRDQA